LPSSQVSKKLRGSGSSAVIYVSEDFGKTFAESCVPVKHVGDKGYELRETHDRHGVYVLIDHDEEEKIDAAAPVYNLYTSGLLNATMFALSLERVFSADYFGQRLADWHRVEAMPGVLIVNQLEIGAMSVKTMKEHGWKDFIQTQVRIVGPALLFDSTLVFLASLYTTLSTSSAPQRYLDVLCRLEFLSQVEGAVSVCCHIIITCALARFYSRA
jgi:hypothetical protein